MNNLRVLVLACFVGAPLCGFVACGNFAGSDAPPQEGGTADDHSTPPASDAQGSTDASSPLADASPPVEGGPQGDGGVGTSPSGCADGTREYMQNATIFKGVAGCSGAFDLPGMDTTSDAASPCHQQGGNDSVMFMTGNGCSAADLCASGWHVCRSYQEVLAGGAGACPDAGAAVGYFYASAQTGGVNCYANADKDNDVIGCGSTGQGTFPPCAPFSASLSTQFTFVPWNLGPAATQERTNVTKALSGGGGVLCCHD